MKQRYIDFVPTKGKTTSKKGANTGVNKIKIKDANEVSATETTEKKSTEKKSAAKKTATKSKEWVNPLVGETEVEDIEEIFAEKPEPAGVTRNGAKFGVIEDYQPKFVKTEVKKRPLGEPKAAKIEQKPAKKPAAGAKMGKASQAKASQSARATQAVKASQMAKVARPMGQRTKFVNVNKIEKRPLSKIDYPKKPVILREEKLSKPEKIIAKPEKDSKAGLIIAIILTIILGAAAGTVAFLLLPK